jgi:hypothetical protein
VLLALLACGACAPKYYSPNTHNAPLLSGRGDYSAAFAFGDGRGELQGAYAFSDAVAGMINAVRFELKDDDEGDGGEGGLLEVGLGYQRPLGEGFQLGVFGLAGGGNLENHFPSTRASNPGTTGILEAKLARFGVQSVLGYRSRYFEAAGSARLVGLRYSEVKGSLVFGGEDQVRALAASTSHTLVEPALTVRGGSSSLKLQLQLGFSRNLTDADWRQDKGYLSAGVVFSPVR